MDLQLEEPMLRGSAVVRLQELGDALGFDYGPNDGIFGEDTERAVQAAQAHLGLAVTGVCDEATWRAMRRALEADGTSEDASAATVDIRGDHPPPKLYRSKRAALDIDTIVLHQTGCKMPHNPRAWRKLNAHLGVLRDGPMVLVNSFLDWIWHAQRLSRRSIGVEIAGNFPGLVGNLNTLWKPGGGPHGLTDAQKHTLLGPGVERIATECESLGIKIRHIRAHRQSKGSRIADPGQEIWQAVAGAWAERFDAEYQDPYRVGTGRYIPREWDEAQDARYWG